MEWQEIINIILNNGALVGCLVAIGYAYWNKDKELSRVRDTYTTKLDELIKSTQENTVAITRLIDKIDVKMEGK